jgi:sterol desaturase/sphingolipid hydroxylase (fatty acid hydroxylase superfamily)
MLSILLWPILGVVSALFFTTFFEWAVHRWLMHRPLLGFDYAFRTHALNHHKKFKADETYHLIRHEDKFDIPMAWWNGPVLIVMCMLPFVAVGWAVGHWAFALAALPVFVLYYAAYEYLHWCMHLPKSRRVEKSELFRRLNGHHLLHHRYMNRNYNVVFPLADLLTGTLLPRSKTHFAQARGPSVPDVQPRAAQAVA